MDIADSFWGLLSAFLVFLGGLWAAVSVGRRFQLRRGRSMALYIWHTLLCLTYLWYALTYGGDALGYYRRGLEGAGEFNWGTAGIDFLTSVIVQGLGLSLLGAFLFFNIFGTIGLLAFDHCLRAATQDKTRRTRRLANLIIFLPSVSFWSSAIGKDSLSFMAAGLALWAALNLGRRVVVMAAAIAVMLLVRPHMAGLMVSALAVAALLDPKASTGKRLVMGVAAAAVAAAMVPMALNYAGVSEGSGVGGMADYIESRQQHNLEGGSSVDIASMSAPAKLLTYLFRPFIFEARSVFALAAGVENLLLIYLLFAWARAVLRGRKSTLPSNRTFLWAYSLMAWFILAITTANLGIALRQKWMFLPMLIFLFLSVMGRPRAQWAYQGIQR